MATTSLTSAVSQVSSGAAAWKWSQFWRDVLFLHWRVPLAWLRPQVPAALDIDTYEDDAWVGFVGFRLEQVQLRGWPVIPYCSSCLELNFRTYVRCGDEQGIFFLTMHADHPLMVAMARVITPLPYALARMSYFAAPGTGEFHCVPKSQERPLLSAQFRVSDEARLAELGLESWLIERYTAFVTDRRGRPYRMRVRHAPWRVQSAEMDHGVYELGAAMGAGGPECCHFSEGVAALLGPFEPVESQS